MATQATAFPEGVWQKECFTPCLAITPSLHCGHLAGSQAPDQQSKGPGLWGGYHVAEVITETTSGDGPSGPSSGLIQL